MSLRTISHTVFPLLAALLAGCVEYFGVVLLPDTQYYSENDPEVYKMQTEWIEEDPLHWKPQYVIHLGDIVHNHEEEPDEWEAAVSAQEVLESAGIPYTIIPGNHDMPEVSWGLRRTTSAFNQHFGLDRFENPDDPGFEHHRGSFPSGKNDNNYSFFEAEGLDFMVIGLEHAASKDAMCWAGDVLEQHRTRRTIVATHCYQRNQDDGGLNERCDTVYNLVGSAGPVLWDELLSRYPQIFMVVSGHSGESKNVPKDRDEQDWDPVHQLITDFQFDQRDGYGNHGNGWLKGLIFYPEQDLIETRIHSVLGETELNPPEGDEDGYYPKDPSHSDHAASWPYNMSGPIRGVDDPIPPLDRFSDRRVNVDSHRHQSKPAVARAEDGVFVTVWEDDSGGTEGIYDIFGRVFDVNGCQLLAPFAVNRGRGQQRRPDVAIDDAGNFVVVWEQRRIPDPLNPLSFAAGSRILMRGFRSDGSELFPQRAVNSGGAHPRVAIDNQRRFVVVWDHNSDIYARGFQLDGASVTEILPERRVNQDNLNYAQRLPAVAVSERGVIAVVWEDEGSNDNDVYEIDMTAFNWRGGSLISQRDVNSEWRGDQRRPDIAIPNDRGIIVVVWDDNYAQPNYQVMMRGFKFDGTAYSGIPEARVNPDPSGSHIRPRIAMHDRHFVVVWEDNTDGNCCTQIWSRGYDLLGNEALPRTTVNRNSRGNQTRPAVSMDSRGRFVVAWEDDLEENTWLEILARGCTLTEGC